MWGTSESATCTVHSFLSLLFRTDNSNALAGPVQSQTLQKNLSRLELKICDLVLSRVSLITGLLITGLDWTGILKCVFMHCGMQLPWLPRTSVFQGCIPIVAQYVQAISYIATPVRRQWCLAPATRMMPIIITTWHKRTWIWPGICDLESRPHDF